MQNFIDTTSPRAQLSFEQLPRGVVKFPDHIVEWVKKEQAARGFTDEFAKDSMLRNTLKWYYEGYPTAYRELDDGIEVLAIGFEEAAKYWQSPEEGIRVLQP